MSQRAFAQAPRRGAATRLLEDERWLAAALLLPTVILLGLFIAYPFVEGVLLSVTDTKVGIRLLGQADARQQEHKAARDRARVEAIVGQGADRRGG